jgi:hypothetical protein
LRFYDWSWVHDHTDLKGGRHSLLIRRSVDTGEMAFYRCWTPEAVPLTTLITVAGRRWSIEEAFHAPPRATAPNWIAVSMRSGLVMVIEYTGGPRDYDHAIVCAGVHPSRVGPIRRLIATLEGTCARST